MNQTTDVMTKNLRVCGDCHDAATKFISKIVNKIKEDNGHWPVPLYSYLNSDGLYSACQYL